MTAAEQRSDNSQVHDVLEVADEWPPELVPKKEPADPDSQELRSRHAGCCVLHRLQKPLLDNHLHAIVMPESHLRVTRGTAGTDTTQEDAG